MKVSTKQWSREEVQYLQDNYGKLSNKKICKHLNRSLQSVYQRASKYLKITVYKRWTADDDSQLKDLWEFTERNKFFYSIIGRRLKRSGCSIRWRAAKLQLPFGIPKGMESLNQAALRTGMCNDPLKKVLIKYQVKIFQCPSRYPRKKAKTQLFVDPFCVDEAVKAWCAE